MEMFPFFHLPGKEGDFLLDNLTEDLQEIQAALMLERRVQGMNLNAIAKEFGVSRQTVERRMALARRKGILSKAVDRVIDGLLTQSLDAYKELLTDPDVPPKVKREAAADIAFGTGVLSKNNKAQLDPADTNKPGARGEMTLRAWREKRLAENSNPRKTKQHRQIIDVTPGRPGAGDASEDDQPSAGEKSITEISVLELTTPFPTLPFEENFEGDGETGIFGESAVADPNDFEE